MIRGFIFAVFLVVVSSTVAMSQTKTDYNKWEVYGGYSNGQVDKGFDTGNSFGAFFRDRRPFNAAGSIPKVSGKFFPRDIGSFGH